MKFTRKELEENLEFYKKINADRPDGNSNILMSTPSVIKLIESVIGLSAALEEIRDVDYRGNRSQESFKAKEALEKWGVGE